MLNAFLSLFTFLSVVPFLRILFQGGANSEEQAIPETEIERWSSIFDAYVQEVGAAQALIWICVGIVGITVLKNAVVYLGLYSLATIRTGVSRDLR
ncbi:MAG: hypothetical protein ACO3MV_07495, partial [Flavobacteriales bacterium]